MSDLIASVVQLKKKAGMNVDSHDIFTILLVVIALVFAILT